MFGTSLHTNSCKRTIALETAELVQKVFHRCELLRCMNYCTDYCDRKQLYAATPLAESTRSPNPQVRHSLGHPRFQGHPVGHPPGVSRALCKVIVRNDNIPENCRSARRVSHILGGLRPRPKKITSHSWKAQGSV